MLHLYFEVVHDLRQGWIGRLQSRREAPGGRSKPACGFCPVISLPSVTTCGPQSSPCTMRRKDEGLTQAQRAPPMPLLLLA